MENLGLNRFQAVLDQVSHNHVSVMTVAVYGGLTVGACVIAYLNEIPKTKLRQGIYYHFKLEAMKKATLVDFASAKSYGTGALLQRIEAGASAGRQMVCDFWLRALREVLPDIIFGLWFISRMDFRIALAVLLGYVVLLATTNLMLRRLYALKRDAVVDDELINRSISRIIMEFVSVRILGLGSRELAKTRRLCSENTNRSAKVVATHEFFFAFFALLIIIAKIATIVLFSFGKLSLSVGGLVALLLYMDRVYNPIAILNVLYVQYKLDRVSLERLEQFLLLPNDGGLTGGGMPCGTPDSIVLTGAGLQLDGATILKPTDLKVVRGASFGIAGPNGAGKSTILRLMLGLLRPTIGDVRVNGISTRDLDLNQFYESVAYVSQDPPVFDGTIRENLLLQDTQDDKRALEVLNTLGLGEFLEARGRGLDSEVGERGSMVSGSERQRLAIARILIHPKPLIVLDEATSAMDSISEERSMAAIRQVASDSILIIVSHKLKTLATADEIIVLESGQLTERGPLAELVNDDGVFNRLWERQ